MLSGGVASFLGEGAKTAEGASDDLRSARLVTTMLVNDEPMKAIEIAEGVTKYKFGEALDEAEHAWLVYQINSFLARKDSMEKSRGERALESQDDLLDALID